MENMNFKLDSLSKWVSVVHRQFQMYMNRHLKDYGLNSSEFVYIVSLGNVDMSLSQEELANGLQVDKAAVTRSIRSLEDKGFVKRERDKDNHRIKRVSLTDKSFEILPDIRRILDGWDDEMKSIVGNDTYDLITEGLYKMSYK